MLDTTEGGVRQVQINSADVRYSLEHDAEFFIQFFLAEELTFPVPSFHPELFNLMTSTAVEKCAFAVPRDHAKTTLAKLAVLHYFLFSKYRFVLYLSNVLSTAIPSVNDIIGFLDSDNFKSIYPPVEWLVKQDGQGFYKFILTLPGKDGQYYKKLCILRALGAGQSIRGINVDHKRPQLAIVDDLEDTENIATTELYQKLRRWFNGTFRKCLDKFDHKIIQIGNMISSKCMLREHCESPFWFSRIYGCLLKDGSALWPDAWSIEKLKIDFNEYLQMGLIDIWFIEMMNMPIGSGRGVIKAAEISYMPEVFPGEIEYGFITVDPAISKKTWAHATGVTVHGWISHAQCWQVVEIAGGVGLDPVRLFQEIIRLSFKWQINVVGIENVNYQAALKPVFDYLCVIYQIENMHFVDLFAGMRKTQRISAWAAMIRANQYALTEGDFVLTQQLLEYNPLQEDKNDDDYIDSAAYGVQMIEFYMGLIQESFTFVQSSQGKNSYQLADI